MAIFSPLAGVRINTLHVTRNTLLVQKGMDVINKELVDQVFTELNRLGQCRTRDEFSREWLGREESYYRSLISKGRTASAEAQLNLAGRLRTIGMRYARSEQPAVREIGVTYLQFYAELIDALLAGSRPESGAAP
jgi:hypothetical protein